MTHTKKVSSHIIHNHAVKKSFKNLISTQSEQNADFFLIKKTKHLVLKLEITKT